MIPKGTVVIQHRTDGQGQYIPAKTITRKIVQFMMNDRVVDANGECWLVRKGGDGRYYTTG